MTMPLGEHVYAVILAGGSGTRFWPRSRLRMPKQLCSLGPNQPTMIEATLSRLEGLVPPERRLVVTHHEQAAATARVCGSSVHQILAEPEAKNTAAALTLAALEINRIYEEKHKNPRHSPVMISLHADHLIHDRAAFQNDIAAAVVCADQEWLVLIGMPPTKPETGFGYIEMGAPIHDNLPRVRRVASFREKPQLPQAERFVAAGNFLWNSGLFVWQTALMLGELERFGSKAPSILTPAVASTHDATSALAAAYAQLPKIAIDHAVLEKSDRVAVIPGSFDWRDVGSWDSLAEAFPTDALGNLSLGDSLLLECKGVTTATDGPLIAALGLENMVICHHGGAVLVIPANRAQDVKKIVEALQKQGRTDLL